MDKCVLIPPIMIFGIVTHVLEKNKTITKQQQNNNRQIDKRKKKKKRKNTA